MISKKTLKEQKKEKKLGENNSLEKKLIRRASYILGNLQKQPPYFLRNGPIGSWATRIFDKGQQKSRRSICSYRCVFKQNSTKRNIGVLVGLGE